MSCEACDIAATNPRTGEYRGMCVECKFRALAQSPGFQASMAAQRLRPEYLSALKLIAGDKWEAAHRAVKAWDARIRNV